MIKASKIAVQINGKLVGNKELKVIGAYDLIPGKTGHISFLDDKGNQHGWGRLINATSSKT